MMTLRESRANYRAKQAALDTILEELTWARSDYRLAKWMPFERLYKWISVQLMLKRETKDWKFYEDLKGRIDHYILHDEL